MLRFNNVLKELPDKDEVVLARVYGKDSSILYVILYWDGEIFKEAVTGQLGFKRKEVIGWLPLSDLDQLELRKVKSRK